VNIQAYDILPHTFYIYRRNPIGMAAWTETLLCFYCKRSWTTNVVHCSIGNCRSS
jgi:hypothetical protein